MSLARAAALAGIVLFAGCNGSERDREHLASSIAADKQVSEELRRADALAVTGKQKEAVDVVRGKALVMAGQNVERLDRLPLGSRWGKERGADVKKLLVLRRKSVEEYADALASDDLARVVSAMEAQKPVEQRALAVEEALRSPPSGCE